MPRPPTAALLLLLPAACTTPPPEPDPGLSTSAGLDVLGVITPGGPEAPPRVVLVRDKHPVHGAVTRSRGPLRDLRRENALALRFLVEKGFTLLGCETSLGPLPDGDAARRHREAVLEAIRSRDDLDAWTVFQPIRHQIQLGGRLEVMGVEDPELYARDVRTLDELITIHALLARSDISREKRRELSHRRRDLLSAVSGRARERGRRAAVNLLHLMERRGHHRAILLLGGAHTSGATDTLDTAGLPYLVFEAHSYRDG